MSANEPEAIANWNPFAQLMAFLVAFIGVSFIPWISRTLDHFGPVPYKPGEMFPAVLLFAGFGHFTGGLLVLRALARVPGARWWYYAIGGIVAAYLTMIFAIGILSLDPEAGPPSVCWQCMFAPRNCLLFSPTAVCWGLTYWLFADLDVTRRMKRAE